MNGIVAFGSRMLVAGAIAFGLCHSSAAMIFVRIPKVGGELAAGRERPLELDGFDFGPPPDPSVRRASR